MKRETLWGPGMSLLLGLQAELGCRLQLREPGQCPCGAWGCSVDITRHGPPSACLSFCPMLTHTYWTPDPPPHRRPAFPNSPLSLCSGLLSGYLSGPVPWLPVQLTSCFPIQGPQPRTSSCPCIQVPCSCLLLEWTACWLATPLKRSPVVDGVLSLYTRVFNFGLRTLSHS